MVEEGARWSRCALAGPGARSASDPSLVEVRGAPATSLETKRAAAGWFRGLAHRLGTSTSAGPRLPLEISHLPWHACRGKCQFSCIPWETPARVKGSAGGVPGGVVGAVGVGEAGGEEALVVRRLDVVGLQPHAGHVDRVDVGREATVRVVDVLADVARAGD